MIWDRFRRKDGAQNADANAPGATDDETDAGELEDEVEEPEGDAEVVETPSWSERATAVIPGGSSTGSKRAEAIYGDADAAVALPTHYTRARGAVVHLVDGDDELAVIDCTMALGSVAIGYADDHVMSHVVRAASLGSVAGMPHVLEVSLAERLSDFIPCAEQVRFLKSGAEAVSAAVRIARTYTGRDHVVCSGYFGWHDWATEGSIAGVPRTARDGVTRVPFDDVAALESAVSGAGQRLAAIVLEPVVERLPSRDWIERARALADRHGAVLVFDEIKTGFRLRPGGYQELAGVEPDLATFGKAMANGFPLAAVVGRADVMEAATRTWISSTLAGESLSLAAAHGVLDWHEKEDVCATLATIGSAMRGAVQRAIDACGLEGVRVDGLDPMWRIVFDDPAIEGSFVRHAVREGALFKRGAYNFAALAHEEHMAEIEGAASAGLVAARKEHGR